VPEQLSHDVRDQDGHAQETVAGDLTGDNAFTLRRALEAAASMYVRITVDLSRATSLDPVELAELMVVDEALRDRDGGLVIVGVPRPVANTIPEERGRDARARRARTRPARARFRSCHRRNTRLH